LAGRFRFCPPACLDQWLTEILGREAAVIIVCS
jgi:hypothetical protein